MGSQNNQKRTQTALVPSFPLTALNTSQHCHHVFTAGTAARGFSHKIMFFFPTEYEKKNNNREMFYIEI